MTITTEAGKRLLAELCPEASLYAEGHFYAAIEATEAEASEIGRRAYLLTGALEERARLAEAVRGLPTTHGYGELRLWIDRAAVLTLLEETP